MLVSRRKLLEAVDGMVHGRELHAASMIVDDIDGGYETRIARREPESVLLDE